MATKSEIIIQVMLDVGDRPTDTVVYSLYETWFDDALDFIYSRFPWNYRRGVGTIDLVGAGFSSFVVPDEVAEIRSLRVVGRSEPLAYMDRARLMEASIDLTQTGSPTHWYFMGWSTDDEGMLASVWPLITEDCSLEYDANLETPLPLSSGDAIPVPRAALGILRELIRAYSYENESQTELAQAAWGRGQFRLERLAYTKGISRPEKKSKLREDGDLAHRRFGSPASRFAPITEA